MSIKNTEKNIEEKLNVKNLEVTQYENSIEHINQKMQSIERTIAKLQDDQIIQDKITENREQLEMSKNIEEQQAQVLLSELQDILLEIIALLDISEKSKKEIMDLRDIGEDVSLSDEIIQERETIISYTKNKVEELISRLGGRTTGELNQYDYTKKNKTSIKNTLSNTKRIEGNHSFTFDIEKTNPYYDKTKTKREYNENCQRCVPAYELRRRGYDVRAKPIPIPDPYKLGQGHNWTTMFESPHVLSCFGNGKSAIIKTMKEWGNGARAEIGVDWDTMYGGGHVFVAEVVDNEVKFIDPQSNNTNCVNYFDFVKWGSVEFFRMDNLEMNELITECFTEEGGIND